MYDGRQETVEDLAVRALEYPESRGNRMPCVVMVSYVLQCFVAFSCAPNEREPAPFPFICLTSTVSFFSCWVMCDRSGASVAGKKSLDLCATSGANGKISRG